METLFHILAIITCIVYLFDLWLNGNTRYTPVQGMGATGEDKILKDLVSAQDEVYMLKSVMDTLEVGIVVADASGVIKSCTRPFEKHLGYIRGELDGKSIHSFVPPEKRGEHEVWFNDFVGSDRALEMRHVRAYGKHEGSVDTMLGVNQTPPIDGKRLFVATIRPPDVHIES